MNGVNRTSHSSNGLTLIEYIRAYNVVIQMERTVETSIGQFTRFTCFLENHLIGDPTFHFTNNAGLDMDINQALVAQEGNVTFWKKQLNSPMADMQAANKPRNTSGHLS